MFSNTLPLGIGYPYAMAAAPNTGFGIWARKVGYLSKTLKTWKPTLMNWGCSVCDKDELIGLVHTLSTHVEAMTGDIRRHQEIIDVQAKLILNLTNEVEALGAMIDDNAEIIDLQSDIIQGCARRDVIHSLGVFGLGRWLWKMWYRIDDLTFILPQDQRHIVRNSKMPPYAMSAELRSLHHSDADDYLRALGG